MTSRQRDPIDGLFDFIFTVIFLTLWAGVAGVIMLLGRKAPPEARLRDEQRSLGWGQQLAALPCRQCGTLNEETAAFCYACGADLPAPEGIHDENDSALAPILLLGLVLLLAVLLVAVL
jgi:hypothetical protein